MDSEIDLPHSLVDAASAVRILGGVDDGLGHVRNVDGLLDGLLSLVPQRHRAELTAPDVGVVAQEAILGSVDIRRADDRGVGKGVAYAKLTLVLAFQPLAAALDVQILGIGLHVQRGQVDEALHASLARNPEEIKVVYVMQS